MIRALIAITTKESGLDFAQARYYNSQQGRFTSVDPLTASASIRNPQTFNRYSYVLNSPYKFTDPLGFLAETTGACGSRCANGGAVGGGFGTSDYDSGHRNGPQMIEAALVELRNQLIKQQTKKPPPPPPQPPAPEQNAVGSEGSEVVQAGSVKDEFGSFRDLVQEKGVEAFINTNVEYLAKKYDFPRYMTVEKTDSTGVHLEYRGFSTDMNRNRFNLYLRKAVEAARKDYDRNFRNNPEKQRIFTD